MGVPDALERDSGAAGRRAGRPGGHDAHGVLALAALLAGSAAGPGQRDQGAPRHDAVIGSPARAARQHRPGQRPAVFQTARTLLLGAGHATGTFTFRERAGVILANQLTVRRGVRAVVDAAIPGVAGAQVTSWASRSDPAASCRPNGAFVACTQAEEWCPMPPATWHFRLVKLSGPAGPIRFRYLVTPPPPRR
jgi:hypothetical protein